MRPFNSFFRIKWWRSPVRTWYMWLLILQTEELYVNLINVSGEHTNQNALAYDEVPPINDISVSIRSDAKPSRILLQPGNKALEFTYGNGHSRVVVPELELHNIIEVIP